ncbi:ATP-binding cassette domain-containing protein [Paracoccus kondratievae]|uniref:ATP-binding cassette domain-containing protein n=1 Tax=Paracoccus kondratievae TaxID=135740 RepID=UPI001266515F|nr:sugar ABC transporter ATP-binding protein [Paracoccus kondratievae]QFQ86677.1 ATP-binding cassette domain-containing protein [Paracoccus kondratievae]
MSLIIQKVTKTYGPVTAVNEVSLSVAPGECRALYGGNGSGKSTIANMVAGVVAPDSGRIEIDGRPLESVTPRYARALGIGITFQELSLMPALSGAENALLGDLPVRAGLLLNQDKMRARAAEQLAPIGLDRLAALRVDLLQTGQKYLLELAKALYLRPKYIIIDELTTTLHASEVELFSRLLSWHLVQGGGALFVSHRLDELRRFCSTISVLRNGELVAEGALADASDRQLIEWAGGAEQASPVPVTQDREAETALKVLNLRLDPVSPPLNLHCGKGEILGLGGLPGQGQKALLRVLAGLGNPAGPVELKLNGRDLPLASPVASAAAGVAFVTGDRDEAAMGIRSIRENMIAPFLARPGASIPNRDALTRALARLSTRYAGLDRPINSLSGGNQQKVLVARCLLAQPALLVAEDATKGIDVAARADVHRLLREMAQEWGTAVLVTSSDDLELVELCDRVLVMEGQSVRAELSRRKGNLSVDNLVAAYMTQEQAA